MVTSARNMYLYEPVTLTHSIFTYLKISGLAILQHTEETYDHLDFGYQSLRRSARLKWSKEGPLPVEPKRDVMERKEQIPTLRWYLAPLSRGQLSYLSFHSMRRYVNQIKDV